MSIEQNANSTPRKPGQRIVKTYEALVEPRLDDIVKWRTQGRPILYICNKLGIGKTAFYEWQKVHPEMAEAIKEGDVAMREEMVAAAHKSLFTKLKDRTVKEEVIEEIKDESGAVIKQKKTTKTRKVFADTTAIIFTLRNSLPDLWNDADKRLIEARIEKITADIETGKEGVDLQAEILKTFRHYGHKDEDSDEEPQPDVYEEPEEVPEQDNPEEEQDN